LSCFHLWRRISSFFWIFKLKTFHFFMTTSLKTRNAWAKSNKKGSQASKDSKTSFVPCKLKARVQTTTYFFLCNIYQLIFLKLEHQALLPWSSLYSKTLIKKTPCKRKHLQFLHPPMPDPQRAETFSSLGSLWELNLNWENRKRFPYLQILFYMWHWHPFRTLISPRNQYRCKGRTEKGCKREGQECY